MKKECRLCGGKLRDGICTECGMDNRKSDELYMKYLNQGECDGEALSHVHEEKKEDREKDRRERRGEEKNKSQRRINFNYSVRPDLFFFKKGPLNRNLRYRGYGKGKNIGSLIGGVVLVIFIMVINGFTQGEAEVEVQQEQPEEVFSQIQDSDIEDYYELVPVRELSETGETWTARLGAGMYLVGYDIPEGRYTLTGDKGNSYSVEDKNNYKFEDGIFGDQEGEVEKAEDIELFSRAIVSVEGSGTVQFTSDNAQIQSMGQKIQNPLTQEFEISETGEAGTDFPAGVYDLTAVGDSFGVVDCELLQEPGDETPLYRVLLMEENPVDEYPNYSSQYKNLVLSAGSRITTEEISVRLTPSPEIVSDDYYAFYNETY